MTEPEPTYTTNGETLPPETVETLRESLMGLRSDGISQVKRYERMLEAIGHPVESAVRTRAIERHLTRSHS